MATASTAEKIVCPKCGFEQYKRSAICKKCGLIFDKWREAQSKRQKAERADKGADKGAPASSGIPEDRTAARRLMLIILLVIGTLAAVAAWRRSVPSVAPQTSAQPAQATSGGEADEQSPAGPQVTRRRPSVSTAGGVPVGAGGAIASLPLPTIDAAYEEYLADLVVVIDALGSFEQQLMAGVSFEEIQKGFLDLRRRSSVLRTPDPTYVTHIAVEQALDAYSQSLRFWNYRAFSERYQGELWCSGSACPFETEQDLRQAVGGMINTCWTEATKMRNIAAQVAGAGDPLVLEGDTVLRDRLQATKSEIAALWERLRGDGGAPTPGAG